MNLNKMKIYRAKGGNDTFYIKYNSKPLNSYLDIQLNFNKINISTPTGEFYLDNNNKMNNLNSPEKYQVCLLRNRMSNSPYNNYYVTGFYFAPFIDKIPTDNFIKNTKNIKVPAIYTSFFIDESSKALKVQDKEDKNKFLYLYIDEDNEIITTETYDPSTKHIYVEYKKK